MAQENNNNSRRGLVVSLAGILTLEAMLWLLLTPSNMATPSQLQANEYIGWCMGVLFIPLFYVAFRASGSPRNVPQQLGQLPEEKLGSVTLQPLILRLPTVNEIPEYVRFNLDIIKGYLEALKENGDFRDVAYEVLPKAIKTDKKDEKRDSKSLPRERIYLERNSAQLSSRTSNDAKFFFPGQADRFFYLPVAQETLLNQLVTAQEKKGTPGGHFKAADCGEQLKIGDPRDVIAVTPEVFYAEMARLAQLLQAQSQQQQQQQPQDVSSNSQPPGDDTNQGQESDETDDDRLRQRNTKGS